MLAVRINEKLEERLSHLAEQTHRSKSYYVKQALESFLDEQEAHLIALSRLEKKNPRISLEEMEERLGLED
jgi:RHH-type transcriptional regulator, rel operon repressor / antitoxin RelB